MALEVKMRKKDNVPIIELRGRVVDVDVKKFIKKIESLYKKDYPRIIVDVSDTNFIDSHGLGTIVYYHTLLQKQERQLIILNSNKDANSYLNRLFDLTNLNKVLTIVSAVRFSPASPDNENE
jgi:anti-anti-sigma factor